jgi:peptidyl-prolyl cis-trans isomerase SurA
MTRIFLFLFLISPLSGHAQLLNQARTQPLDKVVAIVNSNAILKSDVDQRYIQYVQNAPGTTFSQDMWFQILESMVDNFVLVEKAKIDSVLVTDDEVNRSLEQRLQAMVQQVGTEQEVERMFGKSMIQIKAEYREIFREEMLAERVRETQRMKISITRQEVVRFFDQIPTDTLPTIPETVELAQIVAVPPPKPDAESAVYQKAIAVRDSILNHGADFEAMARRYGEDGTAKNGGALPMMPLSDLVSEFSAAAAALEPGGISQVVKTSFGYHIIRLNRRVGDQIETNHILMRIRNTELDDQAAINRLTAIRDSLTTSDQTFFALARRNSDDKNSSAFGGRLMNPQTGERRIPLEALDPALYRLALLLGIGDVSEPRVFELEQVGQKAYRVVKLINRTPAHRANLEDDYALIENFALQRKQVLEMSKWMESIRKDVHIQYMIPVPVASR